MHPVFVLCLLALAQAVSAVTRTVIVGANGTLSFIPAIVVANAGDVIAYEFQSGSHSVVQSTFENPCAVADTPIVNSGIVTIDQAAPKYRTYRLAILNASEPLWIMCGVPGHCMQGMVMVVNPSANKTFDAFKSSAVGLNATTLFPDSAAAQMTVSPIAAFVTMTLVALSATYIAV